MIMEGENPLLIAVKASFTRPSWAFLLLIFTEVAVFSLHVTRHTIFQFGSIPSRARIMGPGIGPGSSCSGIFEAPPPRRVAKSIAEFGGVGDARTSNTAAFRGAVEYMARYKGRGGAQLNVPRGKWLTGSFNLTSDFTLFLESGAVILGSQGIDCFLVGRVKVKLTNGIPIKS